MSGARRRFARRVAVSGAALVAAAGAVTAMPTAATAAGPGVCAGIQRCHVVAHVDVNGDGTPDAVGVARRGRNGHAHSAVLVRVKTGAHTIVSARRALDFWFGSPWHGAAHLDGQKGSELVVGHVAGAHTEFFQALTWRSGKLVTLRAPGADPDWVVDSAYSVDLGWQRRTSDKVGTVRHLEANRNQDSKTFTATQTSYRWEDGAWVELGRATNKALPEKTASTWGGFRIPGLPRF